MARFTHGKVCESYFLSLFTMCWSIVKCKSVSIFANHIFVFVVYLQRADRRWNVNLYQSSRFAVEAETRFERSSALKADEAVRSRSSAFLCGTFIKVGSTSELLPACISSRKPCSSPFAGTIGTTHQRRRTGDPRAALFPAAESWAECEPEECGPDWLIIIK